MTPVEVLTAAGKALDETIGSGRKLLEGPELDNERKVYNTSFSAEEMEKVKMKGLEVDEPGLSRKEKKSSKKKRQRLRAKRMREEVDVLLKEAEQWRAEQPEGSDCLGIFIDGRKISTLPAAEERRGFEQFTSSPKGYVGAKHHPRYLRVTREDLCLR